MNLSLTPKNDAPINLDDISLESVSVTKGTFVVIRTPKNRAFIDGVKQIGAKWNKKLSAWYVTPEKTDTVRRLIQSVFGLPNGKLYSFDIVVDDSKSGEILLNGRVVLNRPGRDRAVQVSPYLQLVDGVLPSSAGSAALPMITRGRAVFRVDGWPIEPVVSANMGGVSIENIEVQ